MNGGPATHSSVTSTSPNPAQSGVLRLGSGDSINWRNNANSADISLGKNTSDQLTFGGFTVPSSATLNSAATNFGTALGTQTLVSSVPATGTVFVAIQAIQTLVGAGCTNVTNSVQPTLFFTAPGGTAESYGPVSVGISISGNGVIDTGDAPSLSAPQQIIAKAGTSITYTTTSTLASTGCSTVPQYTIYAKATF